MDDFSDLCNYVMLFFNQPQQWLVNVVSVGQLLNGTFNKFDASNCYRLFLVSLDIKKTS